MDIGLKYAIIISLIIAYLITHYGVLIKKKNLNSIAWIFWLIMDVIAYYGIRQKGEDPVLVLTFIVGTGSVALVLLLKKQWTFGWTEFATGLLIAGCLIVAKFGNADLVIWASSIAIFAAGIPFLKDLSEPDIDADTKQMCVFFFLAMVFSVVRTVYLDENLIFPITCLIYWMFALKMAYKERFFFI